MFTTPVKLKYRIHEWMADHFKWVQYPNVSGPVESKPKQPVFTWRYDMPLSMRISIALLATFMAVVFSGILIAITIFGFAFFGIGLSFH